MNPHSRSAYCNYIVVGCIAWMTVSLLAVLFCLDNQNTESVTEGYVVYPFPEAPDLLKDTDRREVNTRPFNLKDKDTNKLEVTTRQSYLKQNVGMDDIHIQSVITLPPMLDEDTANKSLHGDMGKRVRVPAELKAKAKGTFHIHNFNMVASDLMSLNRRLPDYRIKECRAIQYPKDLPNISVIIVFHNEAWSTLIRTIHSIVNKSPAHLLKEIILVDDGSEFDYLQIPLEEYTAKLPVNVTVLRTGKRVGLMKGRLKGTAIARGKVLLFMDSHCECTDGWLEPLLYEIYKDRTTVTWPAIGQIDPNELYYTPRDPTNNGGFDWRLHFLWEKESTPAKELPVKSPVLSGGIFAIDREYFYEIGAYDRDMKIWGFENIEISLRIWMCGGRILLTHCSHVGHIFRSSTAYTFPGGILEIISHNAQRVANVWLDDYAETLLIFCPDIKGNPYGDITARKELRQKLQCKNFQWYMENVNQNLLPISPFNGQKYGEIRNEATGKCLELPAELMRGRPYRVRLLKCNPTAPGVFNARFIYTTKKQLLNFLNTCINWVNGSVLYMKCESGGGKWDYNSQTMEFRYTTKPEYCLDARSKNSFTKDNPSVSLCDGSQFQRWVFKH